MIQNHFNTKIIITTIWLWTIKLSSIEMSFMKCQGMNKIRMKKQITKIDKITNIDKMKHRLINSNNRI